jgi:hypothetical protein
VRATVRHARARIAESIPADGFDAHRYISHVKFDRSVIERLEICNVTSAATLSIVRASAVDGSTGTTSSLDFLPLSEKRWQKLADCGPVAVYQNLRAMPRAWFVREVTTLSESALMGAIRSGRLPSGEPFEPGETALRETETPRLSSGRSADAHVSVARYEPQLITLETHNAVPGLLVLSEVFYSGWRARIDDARADIYRVDGSLRGIPVPAGDHRVVLTYLPASFRNGLLLTGTALFLLCAGLLVSRRRLLFRRA